MKILYKAYATSTGGRDGRAISSDRILDLKLTLPRELGGKGETGTNPEQLFAAGYSACFLNALRVVCGQMKVPVPNDASVTAIVSLGAVEQVGAARYALDIDLLVYLPGVPHEVGSRLVQHAHETCPYSNAMRGNIEVRVSLASGDERVSQLH